MPKALAPSIAGLIPGQNGIEAGLQRRFALQSEDDAHRQAYMNAQNTAAQANPTQGIHPMAEGDVGSQWGAFFDSLQRNNASISGGRGVDPMPGLHTDLQSIRTVPSLDGLANPNVKTGRALALQQQDQANATDTAYANPSTPNALTDTSANTAITNQRAMTALLKASAGTPRRGF